MSGNERVAAFRTIPDWQGLRGPPQTTRMDGIPAFLRFQVSHTRHSRGLSFWLLPTPRLSTMPD